MIGWLTVFVDLSEDAAEPTTRFWEEVTGCRRSPPRGEGDEFVTLVPSDGDPHLRIQRLREGPSRVHLDLHVDDVAAAAARAVGAGARLVEDRGHVVMASPGGLPFCLVPHLGESTRSRPHPVGGRPSSVDQVSLDVPASMLGEEAAFWARCTGWERRPTARPEFEVLAPPSSFPLRLLLHRLGADDRSERVAAHLDLACGDGVGTLAARHVALGASRERDHDHWTIMRDPGGLAYCLTARDPGTGTLPPT